MGAAGTRQAPRTCTCARACMHALAHALACVQKRLERRYGMDSSVAVIDLQQSWEAIPEPSFVDEVHPSSTASAQLAPVILNAVSGELSSFGFNNA